MRGLPLLLALFVAAVPTRIARAAAPKEPPKTAPTPTDAEVTDSDDSEDDDPEEEEAIPTPARVKAMRAGAHLEAATLSEQVGLKIHRVVIDAGHGGHDAGAIGPHGVREKDAALGIAKRLAQKLKSHNLEVVLTRGSDTFVPLRERAERANAAHADLFISIHCNAARRHTLAGTETYFLDVASNHYAARLAARENAESDQPLSDLELILSDLATKSNTADSERLAARVQRSLTSAPMSKRYRPIKDLGVKHALFAVLIGAKMPAILVETAFISNPREEQRLKNAHYQEDAAQAVATGVLNYIEDRRRVAGVY